MRVAALFLLALLAGAGVGALAGALPLRLDQPSESVEPASVEDASPAPPPEGVPRVVEVPFRLEESLAQTATTCALPQGVCAEPFGPGYRVFPFAAARDVASLRVELSWSSSSPLTEELRMDLVACGEGCSERGGYESLAAIEGASPLVLALDSFGPDGSLVLLVSAADLAPGPGTLRAHARQDFVLAGSVGVFAES